MALVPIAMGQGPANVRSAGEALAEMSGLFHIFLHDVTVINMIYLAAVTVRRLGGAGGSGERRCCGSSL
jgi:hypothetical protein